MKCRNTGVLEYWRNEEISKIPFQTEGRVFKLNLFHLPYTPSLQHFLIKNSLTLFIVIIIIGLLACKITLAEEYVEKGDYSFDAGIGFQHANVNGNRAKVSEYDALDTGFNTDFNIKSRSRSRYFDLGGEFKDDDDQLYMFDLDASRLFQSETSFRRYKRYLDHDPLSNQDFSTDFDAGHRNSIIREEIKSSNTFRMPFNPNFKITSDYRELNKRGHMQATTVSKCSQCHVTSRNKRINQTTKDLTVGAEMKVGLVTFSYSHLQRRFDESGSSPIAYYSSATRSFPVKNYNYYSTVPDLRTYVNQFKTKADLPFESTLYFDYEKGKHHNRETRNEREFESFAFRLTTACLKYLTFNFNHYNYDMDNDISGSMERDIRRTGLSFRTLSWKKSFLRGSYRWEDIDRNNSAEESTLKKVLTLSLFSRPHRKLDFNLRYKNELTDDPFAMEKWDVFRTVQTILPTRRDELQLSLNWNPHGKLSFSSNIRYEEADSSRYYVDEERLEMMFSIWLAPVDNLIITGSYSLIDTDIKTRSFYKIYHRKNLSDILLDNSLPYDDRSHCYNLTINYRFSRKLAIISNLTFTDSNSDFDSLINDKNVGEFSDLNIQRLDASMGVDYFYKPNIAFYSRYNYRDYNDREVNDLDGEAHIFSFGINYTF
jgi:hypothetical protein